MAVNNIEGSAQQMNRPVANPAEDASRTAGRTVEEQNRTASTAELDTNTAEAARNAFEVNITPEARQRLEASEAEGPQDTQAAAESNPAPRSPSAGSGTEQASTTNEQQRSGEILNIVG
jgi:hypothetical protein